MLGIRRVIRVALRGYLVRGHPVRVGHVRATVRRATHDPLGSAHEERKPEGQCEGQSPNGQRTMHVSQESTWSPERRPKHTLYTLNPCSQT